MRRITKVGGEFEFDDVGTVVMEEHGNGGDETHWLWELGGEVHALDDAAVKVLCLE